MKNKSSAQIQKHLLWLGEPPRPPPEPRFLSRFQWRYKRFRPYALPVRRLNLSSNASADTFALVRNLLTRLPPYPAAIMSAYGVAVLPVHKLWDDAWYMLGWGGARGHDRTDGYDHIGGICTHDGHLAIIAEVAYQKGRGWKREVNLEGVLWHELGHCFDRALGLYSQSEEFRQAWQADQSALKGSYRNQFKYFLQPDGAGESEAFAECFALYMGNRCFDTGRYFDFKHYFPRSFALVKALAERQLTSCSISQPGD